MAEYNAGIKIYNGSEWDTYKPKTSAENVSFSDSDVQTVLERLTGKEIIVENLTVTMPAAGFCYATKSGYKLIYANHIYTGSYGITAINNRGDDTYTILIPNATKGQVVNIQCFWIKA